MKSVSILIPVYNSEQTITSLCIALIDELGVENDLEIVLVNDGSKDKSAEVCNKLQQDYPGIVAYVELARNFGEHNALMAGLNYVTRDYCLMMDDDLQNSPKDALKMIEEIRKGYDVVYTWFETKRDPFFRRLGSRFNDKVANIIFRKPVDLYLSSFKIINRFIIDEIVKFNGPDPYIDGIILRSTDRIGKVQVEHHVRQHGQSGYTAAKLIKLWSSMALNFSLIPLRMIGGLGTVLTIGSLLFATYRRFFDAPYDPLTNFECLMTALLLLVGLLFFSIALLAEYIGKIHLMLYKEPQFIVRSIVPRSRNISVSNKFVG